MTKREVFFLSVAMLSLVISAMIVSSAQSSQEAPKPAYLIVMGKNYKVEDLRPYFGSLGPIYEKYQGTYKALTPNVEVLEGAYGYQSIIMSKWPSIEHARAFWASPEYAEAKKLREGLGDFDVVTFEGFPETD